MTTRRSFWKYRWDSSATVKCAWSDEREWLDLGWIYLGKTKIRQWLRLGNNYQSWGINRYLLRKYRTFQTKVTYLYCTKSLVDDFYYIVDAETVVFLSFVLYFSSKFSSDFWLTDLGMHVKVVQGPAVATVHIYYQFRIALLFAKCWPLEKGNVAQSMEEYHMFAPRTYVLYNSSYRNRYSSKTTIVLFFRAGCLPRARPWYRL